MSFLNKILKLFIIVLRLNLSVTTSETCWTDHQTIKNLFVLCITLQQCLKKLTYFSFSSYSLNDMCVLVLCVG